MADTLGTEQFGSGRAFLVDSNGSEEVGLLRDVSLSFKGTKKPLKSTKRWAHRTAITDQSCEGKVGSARISGKFLATVLGGTVTTGRNDVIEDEEVTIGATASPANVGTSFGEVLKVLDVAGNEMTKVASSPAIGQFTVVTTAGSTKGQLGFNASEPAGKAKVTYSYAKSTGSKAVVANTVISAPTTFKFVLNNAYLSPGLTLTLYAVTVDSIDVGFKSEDWADVSFSFSAEPNSAGNVYEMNWD